ncbi:MULTISPECIES: ScaI family restriction endonuclease [unclassified Microcoleus]|uniref:ScaI family restriction endonuclease n=1 Tax=unclassified Microcoleus TaxID=2642155 RepID=UPI00403F446D
MNSGLFESNLTSKNYKIGVDLFPRPQIMGYFLHELLLERQSIGSSMHLWCLAKLFL